MDAVQRSGATSPWGVGGAAHRKSQPREPMGSCLVLLPVAMAVGPSSALMSYQDTHGKDG